MPYLGEISSILCAVTWAIAVVLFRIGSNNLPASEFNLFKNGLSLLLFSITWFFWPKLGSTPLSNQQITLLIFSGIIGVSIADTLFLTCLKMLGASRYAIISCLFSPFVIIMSFLFLGETINSQQLVGFILVFAGVITVSYHNAGDALPKKQLYTGTAIGIVSVILMSSAMVITKPITTDTSVISVSTVRLFGGTLGSALIIIFSGRLKVSIAAFKQPLPWKTLISGSIMGTYISLIFWITGFKHTSASTASILNQTSVIFILIFAALFLKEKITFIKAAGTILGFSGICLILFHA